MIRSSSTLLARAGSSRAALSPCCTAIASPRSRTALPPSPTLPAPHPLRAFSSTPTPRKRGEPIKLLPEWSWRRPWRGNAVPVVEVVNTAADADAVLETLTSRRLSIDAEPGDTPGATRTQRNSGAHASMAARDGVVSVADGEGVVVLHLANMDRFPETLKRILEDEEIEKQILGAPWWIREIIDTPAFYGSCSPCRILDLRRLAEMGWPTLGEPAVRALVHNEFLVKFAKEVLGLRYAVHDAGGRDYHMKKLQGQRLEVLINQTWFAHCAGSIIRDKVAERLAFKVERNGVLPIPVPGFLKPALLERVEEEAYKVATYDAERIRGMVKEFGGLKEVIEGGEGVFGRRP